MSKQENVESQENETFNLELSEEAFDDAGTLLEVIESALEETAGDDEISLEEFTLVAALMYTRARAEARKAGMSDDKLEELLTASEKWWEEQEAEAENENPDEEEEPEEAEEPEE